MTIQPSSTTQGIFIARFGAHYATGYTLLEALVSLCIIIGIPFN